MKTLLDDVRESSADSQYGKYEGTIVFVVKRDHFTFIGSDFPGVWEDDCRRCESEHNLSGLFEKRQMYIDSGMYKMDCTLWLRKNCIESSLINLQLSRIL